MFFHLYKYRVKSLLKQKVIIFWSLIFPILLGTMFFLSFGNSSQIYENYNAINLAVTGNQTDESKAFIETTKSIEFSPGNPMFSVIELGEEEGKQKIRDGEAEALIIVGEGLDIYTNKSGMSQSVVKQYADRYQRTAALFTDIAMNNPSVLNQIIEIMQQDTSYLQEVTVGGEKADANLQFFYALIAMACMYGSFIGLQNVNDIQANVSALGARRVITPTHHLKLIVADMTAAFSVNFVEILLSWLYLRYILGLDIGTQPALFILVCLVGSIIGVSMGSFIGAASKGSDNKKVAMSLSVSMLTSFLSGLMDSNMKYVVEQNAPIINRINPAALITDCFYCLTVYSDYERYTTSIITLVVIAVLLTIGSFLAVRRTKYVSI